MGEWNPGIREWEKGIQGEGNPWRRESRENGIQGEGNPGRRESREKMMTVPFFINNLLFVHSIQYFLPFLSFSETASARLSLCLCVLCMCVCVLVCGSVDVFFSLLDGQS